MVRDLLQFSEAVGIENVNKTAGVDRRVKFTIKPTSPRVPGSTEHTGTCELELAQ
jgi:hypothetical protein